MSYRATTKNRLVGRIFFFYQNMSFFFGGGGGEIIYYQVYPFTTDNINIFVILGSYPSLSEKNSGKHYSLGVEAHSTFSRSAPEQHLSTKGEIEGTGEIA